MSDPAPNDSDVTLRSLAAAHDAATLARALLARLRSDGRDEAASNVGTLLAAEGIIDPTPPYPRRS
jgi:hypothetical protein